MRLAVFSDIHGNLTAFEAALADFATVGDVDRIWFLGDFAAWGARPTECIALIRALIEQHGKDKVQAIGGNTDRYLVQGVRPTTPPAQDAEALAKARSSYLDRDRVLNWGLGQLDWESYAWLAGTLGRELAWDVAGYGTVLACHAIPGDDASPALRQEASEEEALDALLDREGRLVLVGHTHTQFQRQVGRWHILNPGSVGLSFSHRGYAEWALLTFEGSTLHVEMRAPAFDVQAALDDAAAVGYPNHDWLVRSFSGT